MRQKAQQLHGSNMARTRMMNDEDGTIKSERTDGASTASAAASATKTNAAPSSPRGGKRPRQKVPPIRALRKEAPQQWKDLLFHSELSRKH